MIANWLAKGSFCKLHQFKTRLPPERLGNRLFTVLPTPIYQLEQNMHPQKLRRTLEALIYTMPCFSPQLFRQWSTLLESYSGTECKQDRRTGACVSMACRPGSPFFSACPRIVKDLWATSRRSLDFESQWFLTTGIASVVMKCYEYAWDDKMKVRAPLKAPYLVAPASVSLLRTLSLTSDNICLVRPAGSDSA